MASGSAHTDEGTDPARERSRYTHPAATLRWRRAEGDKEAERDATEEEFLKRRVSSLPLENEQW